MNHFPGSRAFAAALCACALLLAALALPFATTPARAKGHGPGHGDGGGGGGGGWRVLAPVSYKNLTIFPVRAADLRGSEAYITLDEGTKSGTVVITEKGGGTQAT